MGNRAPISVDKRRNVVSNEEYRIRGIANVTDPDGDAIVRYRVRALGNGSAGSMYLGNQRLTPGKAYTLTAKQWSQLTFRANYRHNAGTSTRILVRAYDGTDWGTNGILNLETLQNANRPIIRVARAYRRNLYQAYSESMFDAGELFSFYDQDRNSAKLYEFWDRTGGNGAFFFKGRQRNGRFRVRAEDMGELQYQAGDAAGTSLIQIRGYDGRFWSARRSMRVESIGRPELEPEYDNTKVLEEQERVNSTDLFFKTDPGPGVTQYQVYDGNGARTSGAFYEGIDALAANQIHTLTADEFGNLEFEGGKWDNRSHDEIMIRGHNGTRWSKWTSFTVNTEPNMIDGLLEDSWVNYEQTREPLILTYSFLNELPTFYAGEEEETLFTPLTNELRAAARQALDVFETVLNVRFVETPETDLGTITFGMADLNDTTVAHAYLPAPPETEMPAAPGDVWYNWYDFPNYWILPGNKGPGSESFFVTLHELGHAMGLKHPHGAGPRLPGDSDTTQVTNMSYNVDPLNANLFSETLGLYDIAALQSSYGANTNYKRGNNVWSLGTDQGQRITIWDTGGNDNLTAANQNVGSTIDLREGQYSSIGRHSVGGLLVRSVQNVGIAYGSKIEKATGSDFDDTITGNELDNVIRGRGGDDTLRGREGDDLLMGQTGHDTYIYRIGDGNDTINENGGWGVDVLQLHWIEKIDFGALTFRRQKNDLFIDLTIEDQDSIEGTIRIRNDRGSSRIETLEIYENGRLSGNRIDLDSVFTNSRTSPQNFVLTNVASAYGFLADPV